MHIFCIGFVIEKIFRDDKLWKSKIEAQVSTFLMESLLPEIVDLRLDRGLLIRSGLPKP